ncbi:MAG: hypothetical protein GF350_03725 [Chitinivibrionales bacterium]|nr:hypothetical protein [Chitinivibrionales bacterium]
MAIKAEKQADKTEDVNLQPFMCLMVVLVPILLLQAEFAKISIIDINLPQGRGSQTQKTVKKRKQEEENKLLLTAIITDSVLTLGAKGGFLPSLFYQEYHKYITKDDGTELTVKYDPSDPEAPKHPKTGRPLEIYERYDIFLYACDETYQNLKKTLYTQYGEMLTDLDGLPVDQVQPGDSVYALSTPRRLIIVSNPSEYELRPMSVYDQLRNRLTKVKERFKDADDAEDIIIAAENQVLYDKIVQIMDAAREAEFPNISIAKLRA